MKLIFKLFTMLLYVGSISSHSQTLGSWNCINIKYSVSKKMVLFSEAQLRSLKLYDHFHYYEIKAGLSYEAIQGLKFAMCFGKYDTYKEGGNFVMPKNTDEKRLW